MKYFIFVLFMIVNLFTYSEEVFLFGDFVYLRAYEDGIFSNHQEVGTAVGPGFKAGIGVTYNHDHWDSLFSYTRLETSSSGNSYSWASSFQSLSILLRNLIQITPTLSLRYLMGLKGGWQHETFNHRNILDQQKTWGAGITQGINSLWDLGCGFALYSQAALSALWSRFHVKADNNHIDNDFNTLAPVVELEIGLRWHYSPPSHRYDVSFHIGWEEEVWIHHNQLYTDTVRNASPGDFSLQGLCLGAKIQF